MDLDERLAYVDFLSDSFALKHLDRQPLNLNRIPDHLCVKIAAQQSLRTSIYLTSTNSRYCNLVEIAFLQNPSAKLLYQLLQDHEKSNLLTEYCYQIAFPASNYDDYGEHNVHLYHWLKSVLFFIINSNLRYIHRKDSNLVQEIIRQQIMAQYANYRPISELWEKQQRLGPKRICLRFISDKIWKKILPKAFTLAATRLARTRSTVLTLLEDYMQSTAALRIMIRAERRTIKDMGCSYYESNRCEYQKTTLFEKSFGSLCRYTYYRMYRTLVTQSELTDYSALCGQWGDAKEAEKEKINNLQKLLGHGPGIHDVYYVDRRPPKPDYLNIYHDIFLQLYGAELK